MPGLIPVARLNTGRVINGSECIAGPRGELLAPPPLGAQGNGNYNYWPTGAGSWWPVRERETGAAYITYPLDDISKKVYYLQVGQGYPPSYVLIRVSDDRHLVGVDSDSGDDAGSGISGNRHRSGGPSNAVKPLERNPVNGSGNGTGASYPPSSNVNGNGYGYNQRRTVAAVKTDSGAGSKMPRIPAPSSFGNLPVPATLKTDKMFGSPRAIRMQSNMPSTSRSVAVTPRPTRSLETQVSKRPLPGVGPKNLVPAIASPAGLRSAASAAASARVKAGRVIKPSPSSKAPPLHLRAPKARMAVTCAA